MEEEEISGFFIPCDFLFIFLICILDFHRLTNPVNKNLSTPFSEA